MTTYKWNAEDYAQHSGSQQLWAKELIRKLALNGSENILDIGCGDGKVSAEIGALVPEGRVIGIDNSESMINLAKKYYTGSIYANLAFEVMDARFLNYENRFDVVFSNAVLHWIKDHRQVLKGIHKSLKSRGRILLQMGGEGNAGGILAVLNDLISSSDWRPYFEGFEFPYGFYGVEEYEKLISETGFNTSRVELISKDMQHNHQADLEAWIRTTWLPYTERVPKEKREAFIHHFASRYIENNPRDKDNIIHVAMVRLEVEAEKF
jgi:trans-aconitate methyltransferase